MTDEKFKAYFYNGFKEPELIATDIKGLKNITISDTYAGDVSEEFIETINSCTSMDDLKEELVYFDIFINPDKQDLIEAYLEKW